MVHRFESTPSVTSANDSIIIRLDSVDDSKSDLDTPLSTNVTLKETLC